MDRLLLIFYLSFNVLIKDLNSLYICLLKSRSKLPNHNTQNKKKSTFQEVSEHIIGVRRSFFIFLKPDPFDHWSIQVLKSIAKIPIVLLLILLSPILFLVLLIVFLIAI